MTSDERSFWNLLAESFTGFWSGSWVSNPKHDKCPGIWSPVWNFEFLGLGSLTQWESQVLGLIFRVSDLGSPASFVRCILSLGSPRVAGLESYFSDIFIKSSFGRPVLQSLTKDLVYRSINYFIILCKGIMQEIDPTNRMQLIPLLYSIRWTGVTNQPAERINSI